MFIYFVFELQCLIFSEKYVFSTIFSAWRELMFMHEQISHCQFFWDAEISLKSLVREALYEVPNGKTTSFSGNSLFLNCKLV